MTQSKTDKDKKPHYKYACIYTDGGMRTIGGVPGAGAGIHGYFFNDLETMRYAGVGQLITPQGYQPKATGAQLKDEAWDPTFEQWGLKLSFRGEDKKPTKVSKEADITIVDGFLGFTDQPTNNRGEMIGLREVFTSCPVTADKYFIKADSQLTISGFNTDMDKWKSRGWKKADGQPPKNIDLWEQLDTIRLERKDDIDFSYIPAHSGFYGNEMADRNATHGVMAAVNGDVNTYWTTTNITDAEYWDPSKPIPPIMRTKWCYNLTGKLRRKMDINGEPHYHYFCGDHSKDADDASNLGKEISDAGFSLVYNKGEVPIIEKVMSYHEENMWEHSCEFYKSNVINMIHLANLNTPKELWRMNNAPLTALVFKSHRNDLMSHDDKLLSMMIRPPKLSYRCLDIELEMQTVLYSALVKLDIPASNERKIIPYTEIVCNDVTDLFYIAEKKKDGTDGANKLTGFYDQVAKSLRFKVKHPCSDSTVDLTMSRGIDMPSRNIMSAIADENPKVYIVAWKFSSISFRYGLLIVTDKSTSLWEGYYECLRVLDEGIAL